MIVFFAGNFELMQNPATEEKMARTMLKSHPIYPRLITFFYPKAASSVIRLKEKKDIAGRVIIMLDSGAYSAFTLKKSVDIDAYIAFVEENKSAIDYYITLDIHSEGEASYRNYLYLKSKGLNPIPVYHTSTPIKYLEYYIEQTDFLALSIFMLPAA